MHATWAISLAADSPVLVVPWHDDAGLAAYVDLCARPDCMEDIPEAVEHPSLARALAKLNAPDSPWLTAKCDRWTLDEDDLEAAALDLMLARTKGFAQAGIGSYIDIYHRNSAEFAALERHRDLLPQLTRVAEGLAGEGVQRDGHPAAMLELTLRRCIVEGREGYAITAFLYAIGENPARAEANWAAALAALTHILLKSDAPQR